MKEYFAYPLVTLFICLITWPIGQSIPAESIGALLFRGICVFMVCNAVILFLYGKSDRLQSLKNYMLRRGKRRVNKNKAVHANSLVC